MFEKISDNIYYSIKFVKVKDFFIDFERMYSTTCILLSDLAILDKKEYNYEGWGIEKCFLKNGIMKYLQHGKNSI